MLQADKSAFKAKKIGGPLPGGKPGLKNGPRVGGLRDAMQLETLDFNKKILHASWHPRENTIAVIISFCKADLKSLIIPFRLPQRIICSCIVRHEVCVTVLWLSWMFTPFSIFFFPPDLFHFSLEELCASPKKKFRLYDEMGTWAKLSNLFTPSHFHGRSLRSCKYCPSINHPFTYELWHADISVFSA